MKAYNYAAGNDIVAVAPPSAGKTAALCISILQKIDPNIKACQGLILASNLDAARQIQTTIDDIGQSMQVSSDVCFNTSTPHDGQQIVIGDPNQVYDMMRSGTISIDKIKLLALDEADKLSSRNTDEQIYRIFNLLPERTQVIFLSTTMPPHMLEIAARMMSDPLHIMVKETDHPLDGIKQSYIVAETEDSKLDILSKLDQSSMLAQGVIFCNTRKTLEWLEQKLTARGLAISAMHGDMFATKRAAIMAGARSSTSHVLIATQMLARGIDKKPMTLIVNFDLPANPGDYIHRTGLGSRSDQNSTVINLITADDVSRVQEIERFYNTQIKERH